MTQSRPERSSGILMLVAIVLALLAANSPFAPLYQAVHHAPVHIRIGQLVVEGPLIEWINRGLITSFFFLVGLEIKREILEGYLSVQSRRLLPAIAALGGIAAPAAIYALFTLDDPGALRGWAIPTATDIIVSVGILSLLGNSVPPGLRAFLLAIAIFDDIGAALIIGFFYGHGLQVLPLAGAASVLFLLGWLNKLRGPSLYLNLAVAVLVWLGFYRAGVEPALAGLPLAFAIPLQPRTDRTEPSALAQAEKWFRPRVVLVIVPVFAFLNAGVRIDASAISSLYQPVSLGILWGLVIGKPVGIYGAIMLAGMLGVGRLPYGVPPRLLFGISLIAGAGFTMSFFLVSLSFDSATLAGSARLAVLLGSTVSGAAGFLFLFISSRRHKSS